MFIINLSGGKWCCALSSRLAPGAQEVHCTSMTCLVQHDYTWCQTEWANVCFEVLHGCACIVHSNLAPNFSSKQQANQLSGWECKRLTLRATRGTLTALLNQCPTRNQSLWVAMTVRNRTLLVIWVNLTILIGCFAVGYQARRVKWHLRTSWPFHPMFPSASVWAAATQWRPLFECELPWRTDVFVRDPLWGALGYYYCTFTETLTLYAGCKLSSFYPGMQVEKSKGVSRQSSSEQRKHEEIEEIQAHPKVDSDVACV